MLKRMRLQLGSSFGRARYLASLRKTKTEACPVKPALFEIQKSRVWLTQQCLNIRMMDFNYISKIFSVLPDDLLQLKIIYLKDVRNFFLVDIKSHFLVKIL